MRDMRYMHISLSKGCLPALVKELQFFGLTGADGPFGGNIMAETDPHAEKDEVSLAMEQVLEAEQQAFAVIEEHREKARAMVEAAREKARAIEARADARITRAHRACQDKTSARLEEIMQPAGAGEPGIGEWDDELIASAVARLAARMTGGDGGAEA